MRQLIIFSFILMLCIDNYSQKIAVIKESGKEIEVYDDGTWKFVYDDPSGHIKIDTLILNKSKESDYLVESTKLKYGVWFNKKKWNFTKNPNTGTTPTEFNFSLKGEDAYGMIIAERVEIPIDNLLEIAFQNAQKAASDIQLIKKECRLINGKYVYLMEMTGTIKGMKFTYIGYYYSDANGSIQFLTYTYNNLVKQYRTEMEGLLNGLTIKE